MNSNQKYLAKWLVAELEVFAEIDLDMPGITDSWIVGMLRHGIPFTPSYWAGDENPRRKMQLVRAAKQLEQIGLLERVTEPSRDRTTHVIPSLALISETIDQLGDEANVDAVIAALSRTDWGAGICLSTRRRRRRRGVCGPLSQLNESYTQRTNQPTSYRTIEPALIASPMRPRPHQRIRSLDAHQSKAVGAFTR